MTVSDFKNFISTASGKAFTDEDGNFTNGEVAATRSLSIRGISPEATPEKVLELLTEFLGIMINESSEDEPQNNFGETFAITQKFYNGLA